jgi:hypothetical protein
MVSGTIFIINTCVVFKSNNKSNAGNSGGIVISNYSIVLSCADRDFSIAQSNIKGFIPEC